MENLSIHDGPPQQTVPQLPPQMFTTAAQLLDLTDKKLLLALRDGRKVIGVLRSWDQFGNLVLQDAVERIFVRNVYADVPRGIFLVRGENVTLLGEIDLDKDDDMPARYQLAPIEEVHALRKAETEERRRTDRIRVRRLRQAGFDSDLGGVEAILL